MEGGRESSPFSSQWQKVPSFPSSSSSSSSSSGIRPWVLVLLASIFVVLFIPSFLSSNFRGFRPSLVKNGWDTLNLALVVFAILCGLIGRDAASGGGGSGEEGEKMPALQPHPPLRSQEWDAYSPAPELDVYEEENRTRGIQRMRSSSSYPDLRQEFHAGDGWGVTAGWRFVDDIEIYRRRRLGSLDETTVKSIQVNTVELPKSPMWSRSPSKTPPPSSPTVPVTVTMTANRPPPTPPPPPPPPPPLFPKQKIKSHRKRKDIATAIALFYNKKNRRSKTKKISNDESPPAAYPSPLHVPPPAPPPPPPPSSVFSQIFTYKKGGNKMKMSHSIPVHRSSPPPPPPPPPNFRHWKEKEVPIQQPPPPPPPPSTPPRVPRKKRVTRPSYLNTYPIAPPSPLPPPPPPPPPGDDNAAYAKIAGEGTAPPFCPSPDVNNKADIFIKRFRAGLKMEKLNSIREKNRRQQEPPQERLQEAGIEVEMEREIMAMMMGQGGLSEE